MYVCKYKDFDFSTSLYYADVWLCVGMHVYARNALYLVSMCVCVHVYVCACKDCRVCWCRVRIFVCVMYARSVLQVGTSAWCGMYRYVCVCVCLHIICNECCMGTYIMLGCVYMKFLAFEPSMYTFMHKRTCAHICKFKGCSSYIHDMRLHLGWRTYNNYDWVTDAAAECPGGALNICGGNGICLDSGECQCHSGWSGYNCSRECPGCVSYSPLPVFDYMLIYTCIYVYMYSFRLVWAQLVILCTAMLTVYLCMHACVCIYVEHMCVCIYVWGVSFSPHEMLFLSRVGKPRNMQLPFTWPSKGSSYVLYSSFQVLSRLIVFQKWFLSLLCGQHRAVCTQFLRLFDTCLSFL